MRRIKIFAAVCAISFLLCIGGVPSLVSADPAVTNPTDTTTSTTTTDTGTAKQTVCQALDAGTDCLQDPHGGISVNKIITTIVNVLSFVVGVVAVIMIMVGGFRYVTSAGDSSKASSAKSTITYAIVGIVIVASAQVIVRYVLVSLK